MIRFLAFVLLAVAGGVIAADVAHFWSHGSWSLYTFGNFVADQGIIINDKTAPLTHEFLVWLRPAPVGIVAAFGAGITWMLQPRYFPKAIADFA